MNRRQFLIGAALLPMGQGAFAQKSAEDDPIDRVGPYKADAKQVFEFFLFSCFYCQQYHEAIASWGRSIPAPVKFEPVPVVVDYESFKGARVFYTVQRAAPERLNDFVRVAFDSARKGIVDLASPEVLRAAGVSQKAFDQAWVSPAVKASIERAMTLTARYGVAVTPSLGIGGRHVLHADQVGGDYGALMRLASGFVSRILEGGNA